MTLNEACSSDFTLDLLLGADLPEAEERRVRAHLVHCSRCAARFGELERQRDSFATNGPRLDLCGNERALGTRRSATRTVQVMALASAALLLLLVVGIKGLRPGHESNTGSLFHGVGSRAEPADQALETRTKGGEPFELYIRHGNAVRKASDRERVHAGDQLQFAYSATADGYVAVLSRDGGGMASIYFPGAGNTAWPARAGQNQMLPESTILDETPGQELIYALFCARRVELEPLHQALARGRPLEPPSSCSMRSIELDKRARE
jgi:hypothetical protein